MPTKSASKVYDCRNRARSAIFHNYLNRIYYLNNYEMVNSAGISLIFCLLDFVAKK